MASAYVFGVLGRSSSGLCRVPRSVLEGLLRASGLRALGFWFKALEGFGLRFLEPEGLSGVESLGISALEVKVVAGVLEYPRP